jgi:tetratricopeptide (TPR) repeat protein
MNRIKVLLVAILLLVGFTCVASGQETLTAAKALYTAAAYEDALTMLTRLKGVGTAASGDLQVIDQYRAFCLLALGRQEEAQQAIEAAISLDPSRQLSDAEASPSVRATFREVRRRLLPGIAQQRYAAAKATYDRKEFSAAAEQFAGVIELLDTPDVDPALADLKKVAEGFRDLSLATAAKPATADPAPAPSATSTSPDGSASPPVSPPASQPPAAAPPASTSPRVFDGQEQGVTPPVPIRQDMPRWPATPFRIPMSTRGILDVVIDETGAVESAVMRQSLNALYDGALLRQTRLWRYQPAMKDGKPVKFLKRIQIAVSDQ